jgi:hypothetical protein
MSRWRLIVLASLPRLSACPKPTAETRHDPGSSDNEIKNGDVIPYAGLLSACASRARKKAAAAFKVDALSGAKASPLLFAHSREYEVFSCRAHLGTASQWSCFLAHRSEILQLQRRFVTQRVARNGRAMLGVG